MRELKKSKSEANKKISNVLGVGMILGELFEMEHSSIRTDYVPLKDLKNQEYEDLLNRLGLDINNFYLVNRKLYPICYMNGMVYVEIYQMSETFFIDMKMRDIILFREKHYKELLDNKMYGKLFTLIDKPYRFYWYQQLYNDIPLEARYELFIDIYRGSEYGFNSLDKEFVQEVFSVRPHKEINIFTDVVTIYRGEGSKSTHYSEAYSWTTQLKTAKFFANRFNSDGVIYQAKVNKKDIIDYLEGRGEAEILVMPNKVYDIERIN